MRNIIIHILKIAVLTGCVSPIEFAVETPKNQLIVEGNITDGAPPYTVRLSNALDLNEDTLAFSPESNATVFLYDDLGNTEELVETTPGHYESSAVIQGTVGRAYHVTVRTSAGADYTSIPDTLRPVGSIAEIRYTFESRSSETSFGEVDADVFNVFVDANGGEENNPNIRWKMRGIFRVVTWPHLHMTEVVPYTPYKNPFPCSGYIVVEGLGGGKLLQIGPCTCCDCWAYQYEDFPALNSDFIVEEGQYQNVKVGEVPITNFTFHDKYLVEVEQMSLSDQAMTFFESVRAQKENAADLFQPQLGTLHSNIVKENGEPGQGIFYASSTQVARRYISKEDVPYPVVPITFITLPCHDAYDDATTLKPEFWID